MQNVPLNREANRTQERLVPRLEKELTALISADPQGWQIFLVRLRTYFSSLFRLYHGLYGNQYDFFFHLEDLLISLARSWFARAADLRALDQRVIGRAIVHQESRGSRHAHRGR